MIHCPSSGRRRRGLALGVRARGRGSPEWNHPPANASSVAAGLFNSRPQRRPRIRTTSGQPRRAANVVHVLVDARDANGYGNRLAHRAESCGRRSLVRQRQLVEPATSRFCPNTEKKKKKKKNTSRWCGKVPARQSSSARDARRARRPTDGAPVYLVRRCGASGWRTTPSTVRRPRRHSPGERLRNSTTSRVDSAATAGRSHSIHRARGRAQHGAIDRCPAMWNTARLISEHGLSRSPVTARIRIVGDRLASAVF